MIILGPFYRLEIGAHAVRARRAQPTSKTCAERLRTLWAFAQAEFGNIPELNSRPAGPEESAKTLGRVSLGSREGPNVARSLGTASTVGCPSRRACL